MPIFKRCNICHQLYEGKRCPTCKKKMDRAYQQRKKERDETQKAYYLRLWEKCRKNVLLRYNGYDIWALADGRLEVPKRVIIHHIRERTEDPAAFFDIDNLIPVSHDSHQQIHELYKTDKAAALERIQRGKKTYAEMFGAGMFKD